MNTIEEAYLGVDFGRVIQGGAAETGAADTVLLDGGPEEAMRTPSTAGAFEVLPRVVARFGGRAWVISKCGQRIQRRTLQWLDHHDFYQRTGIPRGNVRFCRRRADKAVHCAEPGITHMIEAMVYWATVFIMTKRLTRYESGQPLSAPERPPAGRSLADYPWTAGPPGASSLG
jgi:hypothetical protein